MVGTADSVLIRKASSIQSVLYREVPLYTYIQYVYVVPNPLRSAHPAASWSEDLQKYIHPDQLPEYYGGTRREPDAKCSDKVE